MTSHPRLSQNLSPDLRVTLDALRALAAGYVVLHHVSIRSDAGLFDLFLRFGQEAVMVFFLLSGFVIHANERHRATSDVSGYLARRATRIYPTLLFAMLVSLFIAAVQGQVTERFEVFEVFCTLFALQDAGALKPGTICSPFMGNSPLWSLSYELVFYAIYPAVLPIFLKNPRAVHHVIGLACVCLIFFYALYPSHFLLLPSYFLIWWVGAMMAEHTLNSRSSSWDIYIPLAYLTVAVSAWSIVLLIVGIDRIGTYPALMFRHFGTALIFTIFMLSPIASWIGGRLRIPYPRFWQWASAVSYGAYVIHFPLVIQWKFSSTWTGFVVAVFLIVILSDLGDRRLNLLMRRLTRRRNSEA